MLSTIAAAAVGVVLACAAVFGVVASQTAAPAKNPVSEQIITYGDR